MVGFVLRQPVTVGYGPRGPNVMTNNGWDLHTEHSMTVSFDSHDKQPKILTVTSLCEGVLSFLFRL
jgi:hypothetical protein